MGESDQLTGSIAVYCIHLHKKGMLESASRELIKAQAKPLLVRALQMFDRAENRTTDNFAQKRQLLGLENNHGWLVRAEDEFFQ